MMAFSSGRAVPTMSVKKNLELEPEPAGEHEVHLPTGCSLNHQVFWPRC